MTNSFDIFPAIDLLDGQSVRLKRGSRASAEPVASDPIDQLRHYAGEGAKWVHVVNLNAAFGDALTVDGARVTRRILRQLMEVGAKENLDIRFQIGGGVRSEATAIDLSENGADRIVVGTWALKDPEALVSFAGSHPGLVAVGLDALEGRLQLQGWTEGVPESNLFDVAKKFAQSGIDCAIYTQIERDGMLTGVNVDAMTQLAEFAGLKVIASGGVSSIDDVSALSKKATKGVCGVIIGKALHAGRLQLREALKFQSK